MIVRPASEPDAAVICTIHNEGSLAGRRRSRPGREMLRTSSRGLRVVCPFSLRSMPLSDVVGWARVSAYADRCVYAGIGEHGVYVAASERGRGIGRGLLDMDDVTRRDMQQWTGCIAGALTREEFERALTDAGLVDVEIRETHRVHEHAAAAIVRATKPAGACCSTTVLETCCEPSAKTECCGDEAAPGTCGCSTR